MKKKCVLYSGHLSFFIIFRRIALFIFLINLLHVFAWTAVGVGFEWNEVVRYEFPSVNCDLYNAAVVG